MSHVAPGPDPEDRPEPTVLGSSAVMAAGTIVSRLSGFVRATLLAAAIGTQLHADIFNIANTIPNMLYILLAGGVFNAVLVPQLVRAIKNDPDGGAAYTNRVITLAVLFLGAVSVLLVVAAPLVMRVLVDPSFFEESSSAELDSLVTFARYCMPQVFFYGMFVLVGQVLNARRSFGPMMWAPIANNIISVVVLVSYLVVIGPARGEELDGAFSGRAEALLGIGSTLGIAAQFLILVPYLKRSGFTFRPRFDFRNSGLGHTFRLASWTVLFVVVNQVAYTVVVRIASSGSADGGTGYTIYSNAFLLVMVPHAIITVSLATAVLPRLAGYASNQRMTGLALAVSSTMRSTYALVLPVLAMLPIVATDVANLVFKWGSANKSYTDLVPTLSLFVLGAFFFTSHYLVLRGFYALEQNRRVFFIQCVIAVVNIGAAILLTHGADPQETAPRLVIAYTLAYAVGAALSFRQLSVQTHGLGGGELVRFSVRIIIVVGLAAATALGARELVQLLLDGTGKVEVILRLAWVGAVGGLAYLFFARLFRLTEVTEVVGLLTSRLGRSGR
ncbi:putative peptidoglycan lipid II flippase [Marmoricola sp. OAE513]|uniref:murein biosynthesis integral membrane protein MurJ n=1 Tax=Marmoricola sp. OAE513 TaxID=2817894 RepID=UPI001AEB2DC6